MADYDGGVLMSGIATSVAVCVIAATMLTGATLAAHVASVSQRVASAADAAALAAADATTGAVSGEPCVLAARLAERNGAHLTSCVANGFVITVAVSASVLGYTVIAEARAGPPP